MLQGSKIGLFDRYTQVVHKPYEIVSITSNELMDISHASLVDDPAHYRWTSYRHNALGQTGLQLSPHPLYVSLG